MTTTKKLFVLVANDNNFAFDFYLDCDFENFVKNFVQKNLAYFKNDISIFNPQDIISYFNLLLDCKIYELFTFDCKDFSLDHVDYNSSCYNNFSDFILNDLKALIYSYNLIYSNNRIIYNTEDNSFVLQNELESEVD